MALESYILWKFSKKELNKLYSNLLSVYFIHQTTRIIFDKNEQWWPYFYYQVDLDEKVNKNENKKRILKCNMKDFHKSTEVFSYLFQR